MNPDSIPSPIVYSLVWGFSLSKIIKFSILQLILRGQIKLPLLTSVHIWLFDLLARTVQNVLLQVVFSMQLLKHWQWTLHYKSLHSILSIFSPPINNLSPVWLPIINLTTGFEDGFSGLCINFYIIQSCTLGNSQSWRTTTGAATHSNTVPIWSVENPSPPVENEVYRY